MASRAFITVDQVAAWTGTQNPNNAVLAEAVEAACAWIENRTRTRILQAAYSVWHSGSLAIKPRGYSVACDLFLCDPDGGHLLRPVIASPAPTVTEEGTSLTVYRMSAANSFSDGEAVLLYDKEGVARRVEISSGEVTPTAWEPGLANIRVSCTAGYAMTSDTDPTVPGDLVQVARHLAAVFYREGKRTGIAQANDGQMSLGYDRLLPPNLREALDFYTFPAVPRTFEG